jgi:hypothetical protein
MEGLGPGTLRRELFFQETLPMRRRMRLDLDYVRLVMSWRLAWGIAVGGALAVTWAYAYGDRLVTRSDERRDQTLKNYPTWPQVLNILRDERKAEAEDAEKRQAEVLKRLDRIEDRLMRGR